MSLPQITINKNDPTVVVEVREGSPPADQSALVAQQAQQIQALTSERDAAVQAATAALGERDRAVKQAGSPMPIVISQFETKPAVQQTGEVGTATVTAK